MQASRTVADTEFPLSSVVGSDFTIPLQSDSQASFRIALNNGLHSVETAAYPLRSKVDIGQEFELSVFHSPSCRHRGLAFAYPKLSRFQPRT